MGPFALALTVAVETAPVRAPPELEQRLLTACTAGLSEGRCTSAGAESSDVVAMVSWIGSDRVLIEVGVRRPSGAEWLSRELHFAPTDPLDERFRAAGFTIASLLRGDADALDAPPAGEEAVGAPRVGLRVGALAGTGLIDAGFRFGAGLRLSAVFAPGWFVGGSVSLSRNGDDDPAAAWLDLSLGGGLSRWLVPDGLEARLRVELLVENVAAKLRRNGVVSRANAWVPGVLAGGELLWALSPSWAGLATADLFWLDGATVIRAAGQREATSAGLGVLFGLGAEYRF